MRYIPDKKAHFYTMVNIQPNGCHLWTGCQNGKGYANYSLKRGKPRGVHRIAWEMANGPIPHGMQVCHRCDVRNCVNPDHLFIGTNTDNVRDMIAKGRQRFRGRR